MVLGSGPEAWQEQCRLAASWVQRLPKPTAIFGLHFVRVLKIVARGTPPSLPRTQVPVSSLRPARHAAGPALLAQPWALPELF